MHKYAVRFTSLYWHNEAKPGLVPGRVGVVVAIDNVGFGPRTVSQGVEEPRTTGVMAQQVLLQRAVS